MPRWRPPEMNSDISNGLTTRPTPSQGLRGTRSLLRRGGPDRAAADGGVRRHDAQHHGGAGLHQPDGVREDLGPDAARLARRGQEDLGVPQQGEGGPVL